MNERKNATNRMKKFLASYNKRCIAFKAVVVITVDTKDKKHILYVLLNTTLLENVNWELFNLIQSKFSNDIGLNIKIFINEYSY